MRGIFLLLVVFLSASFLFAYDDPPINEVDSHNEGIAAGLMGAKGISLGPLTDEEPAKVNMSIVVALPQVDERIPSDAEGIIWAWNEKNADGQTLTHEDADGCTDYYLPALINYSRGASMSFNFRNETRAVVLIEYDWVDEAEGREMETDAVVGIPFSFEELEAANGTENLTVELQWRYAYFFEVVVSNQYQVCVDNGQGGQSCHCESSVNEPLRYWDILVTGNASESFIIESGNASFLLVRPVLGEQWYQNDHFDTLVFSRKSIYKAEISMDGNESGYARVYDFSVLEDPMGAWHIFSNSTANFSNASMAAYSLSYWATPVVKENNSFSHLYEINHTYEGWGPHLMLVRATDFFLGEHEYEKEIFDRKISRWGVSETGEPAGDPEYYRPGKEAPEEEVLAHKILPPAAIGMLVLLLALGAFWYYRKWGKAR